MTPNTPTPTTRGDASGERRQLTVMFCDLVDSTALAERLDPEEYGEVVATYQRTCAAEIERFEGRIAQYLGDGLLVYFGYPVAHEDDARRAVHAGLGILEALEPLNQRLDASRGVRLSARLGIHTGLVVVGELGGRGRQERLAVGEAPNVAARLQGLAAPDTLVISAATHRLVQPFFTFQPLGRQTLRGLSAPLAVYQVLGESGVRSRLEVARTNGLTPLVGREREVEILHDRWTRVREGIGQVVLLSGEAGLGKSRLVEAMKDHVADKPHVLVECRCSPYYQNTALYPIIDLLQRLLDWRREDGSAERLRKLEESLTPHDVPLAEVVPLFAALLRLPLPADRYPPLALTPPRQRARTLEAVLTLLRRMASGKPLLLIMEDLHWVDPTTLELLTMLVAQDAAIRTLSLLVFRPEFRPSWEVGDRQTSIALTPLADGEARAMIARVAGGKPLPAPVLAQLVMNTDGNPLFVEELTKMVLESDMLQAVEGRYELAAAPGRFAIPTTLHDSLLARLDRLGPAKSVAQLAATLGRTFPYEWLQAVSPLDAPALDDSLARLRDAGLLYEQSGPPHARYLFKHALVQEAAYQSLLRTTRQQYHQLVGRTLAEKFSEVAENHPELIAHHYTEAGLGDAAIAYWHRAGQRALERSANTEAITHLTRGLDLVTRVADGPQRVQQEIELQVALGAPLMATRGYGAPEVEKVFARVLDLSRQVGETPQLFTALRGLRTFYQIRGDSVTASELGEQLLRLAERDGDPALVLEAHYALGAALFWTGHFGRAHEHFERVHDLYDRRRHRSHAYLFGNDPGVVGYSYSAWTLWYLGHPDRSLERMEQGLAYARELDHPFTLAFAFSYAMVLHYFRREPQATIEWAERAMALASEHGFPFWSTGALPMRGWALSEQGRSAEGIRQLREGLALSRAAGAELGRPTYLVMLAHALARTGALGEAFAALDEAVGIVARRPTHEDLDVYHAKAALLLTRGQAGAGEAAACLRHVLDLARRQGARWWELRATTSLGRLLQREGQRAEARRLLAEVYSGLTEGFDTVDAREARALLDELS